MSNFKKLATFALACALAVAPLTACGNKDKGENTAPVLDGIDNITVVQGAEFNVLSGVTATDKEDGDLTDQIEIECDSATVSITDGILVASATGEYTLTYLVTDSGGKVTEGFADLTVTAAVAEEEDYLAFDFAAAADKEVDMHGWNAAIVEDAKGEIVKKGVGGVRYEITDCGKSDGQITLSLDNVELKADAAYNLKVYMKSDVTAYCHLLAIDGDASEWKTYGGKYNVEIGTKTKALELAFTADHATTKAKLNVNLGKISAGNKVQPQAYNLLVEKVELTETTGKENLVELTKNEFATQADVDHLKLNLSGNAAGAVTLESGAAKVALTKSGDEGIWNARFHLPVGKIEKGKKYRYSYEITADKDWTAESLVESAANFDKNRANFLGGIEMKANIKKTVTQTFVADNTVNDGCVRLQIGKKGNEAVNFIFDNFVLQQDQGTKTTKTTVSRFSAFGYDSANANDKTVPFDCFNGTDEQNPQGIGTIWCEGESLFYSIDQVGTADWHNKLVFGFQKPAQGADNPILLAPAAYYTVRFKIKATQAIENVVFELAEIGNWDNGRILTESLNIGEDWTEIEFTTVKALPIETAFEMVLKFGAGDYKTDIAAGALVEMKEVKISKLAVVD